MNLRETIEDLLLPLCEAMDRDDRVCRSAEQGCSPVRQADGGYGPCCMDEAQATRAADVVLALLADPNHRLDWLEALGYEVAGEGWLSHHKGAGIWRVYDINVPGTEPVLVLRSREAK